jgi:hypothetical protein
MGERGWRDSIGEVDGGEELESGRGPAPGKITSTSLIGNPDLANQYRPPPGKRTLTMRLPAGSESPAYADPGDQPHSGPAPQTAARPTSAADSVAASGVVGSGQQLPYLDRIQSSFGAHDVTGVRAHVGGAAASSSRALGASAYAIGDAVAFASSPDLHTAAHEAAHVVQQRGGVQLKGGIDGGANDPYERHADQVADAVVAGHSAEALLGRPGGGAAAPAVVQRKEEALDKAQYVGRHLQQIVDGARTTLESKQIATFSKYATWTSNTAVASAVAQAAVPSSLDAGHLQALLQPASVYDIADRARVRTLDNQGGASDKGTSDWQPAVGTAVGAALAEKLTDSVKRMMPRYLDARHRAKLADEKASGVCKLVAPEPAASDVVPSHPLDVFTIKAMCSGIVKFDTSYRAEGGDDRPAPRKPERMLFTWETLGQGAFWIRVTGAADAGSSLRAPADATAEDVALTLFGTTAEAHELVAAPPRFGFTHAYKLLEPHKRELSGRGAKLEEDGDPTKVLLAAPGPAADDAALAQTTGPTKGKSSAEIVGKMRENLGSLDQIVAAAKKLGVDGGLEAARTRLDQQSQRFGKADADFAEVSKWENHAWLQASVLSRVSFGLGSLDERLTKMTAGLKGTLPAFDKLNLPHFVKTSLKRVAAVFVEAAASSHLPVSAAAKADQAEAQNQTLPAEMLEGMLTDVLRVISETQKSKKEFKGYHPNYYPGPYKADANDTKRMAEQEAALRAEVATLRVTLLNDPAAAAEAFKRIQEKVLDLQGEADLVGNADELDRLWIELERAVFRSPMPSGGPLPARNPLWEKIHELQKEALGYRSRWEAAHAKWKSGDKEGAKTAVKALRTDPRLPVFLGEVGQAINDSYAIETINKITALLAITVATMGVGAWVGGVAAGFELGTGATILAVSAAEAVTFTVLSQAILDNDHSIKHISTELLFNFGMFGALRGFSRMLEAAKLAKGVAVATEMGGQAVILGAATYAKQRFIEKGRPLTEQEIKQLCIEGVVMFVAIAIIARMGSPILKELEGAGRTLGTKIKAANDAAATVEKMAVALKGSPGDVAKALETIQAERGVMTQRMEAYEALEARVAEEAKTPPKKGESVFDKTGLTPERIAEIKTALGQAQQQMKAAEVMLTLEATGPNTFACPKQRIGEVLKNFDPPTATTEDPVSKAKTYTVKAPDGRMVQIVERIEGPTGKPPAETKGAPEVKTDHLPEGAQSTERWQTKGINEDAPDLWNKKSADGKVFRDVYAEWMAQAERIVPKGDGFEPVYPKDCPAEFKPIFDSIVKKGNITLTTQGQANTQKLKDAGIDLNKLDPLSPEYLKQRPKIIEILGEKAVLQWETTKLGDPSMSKVGERIHKVASDEALAALRQAFPDCEIVITGSATQTGKELGAVKDLDVVLIVPEGTTMEVRIGLEKRAAGLTLKSSPELVKAGGPAELKVDAKAMLPGEYMGLRGVASNRTPMQDTRIDVKAAGTEASKWVDALKARLTPEELAKFEKMVGGKTPKTPDEIQKMFEGRLDTAIARIRESLAKDAAKAQVMADSKEMKVELRARIEREGLMKNPEIQELVDSIKPDESNLADVIRAIRGKLAGEIAARNAEAAYPEAEVLRDVKVWTRYPETDIPTWRTNRPEMKADIAVQVKEGKVHLLSTDIDVMVITPREPGKPSRIIERQEVKSGESDTFSDAKGQLLKQKRRLSGDFEGGEGILVEHQGKNITGEVDMASDATAQMKAIGPAGKDGFSGVKDGVKGESSKITGSDMEGLVKDLVKLEQKARTAKPSEPGPTDPGTLPPK